MASILALAGAALIAAPSFHASPVESSDYPPGSVREGQSGAALLELNVDPQGRIYRCAMVSQVGSDALVRSVCRLVSRKLMKPATNGNGVAAYGALRQFMIMAIPGAGEQATEVGDTVPAPDFEFKVNRLPAWVEDGFLDFGVSCDVDASGRTVKCDVPSEGNLRDGSGPFLETARKQLAMTELPVLLAENGTPVAHVRSLSVRFSIDRSGADEVKKAAS